MKNYIIQTLLFFLSINALAMQADNYTSIYNLHFTTSASSNMIYPWIENSAYSNYSLSIQTTDSLFGKEYVKDFFSLFTNRFRTELEQRILLPFHKDTVGKVDFECKGENIESIFLIVSSINNKEEVIFLDTLQFKPDTLFHAVSMNIQIKDIELLDIKIHVEGDIEKDAYIIFSKLKIFLNDKPLDDFKVRELTAVNAKIETIKINAEDSFKKIKLANPKIIGLGESIHGNSVVKNIAYQYIMHLIEYQGCNIVLLEMPLENSLAYNRYIQDKNFELYDGLYNDISLIDFLRKLRKYNSDNPKNKVQLLGFDYNSISNSNQGSAIDIFDYISNINKDSKIKELDLLALMLMDKDNDKLLSYLEKNKDILKTLLPYNEYEYMYHILKLSTEAGLDGINKYMKRDSVMFENTKFIIDNFSSKDDKVLVYGHTVHINPISTYPVVSCTPFGNYMKEKYFNNYSPLAILVGNGECYAYDGEYNRVKIPLHSPPEGSIEFFLNSFKDDVFYLPVTKKLNHLVLSRFKGSHHLIQEFYTYNLYQRYDGLFFIKNAYITDEKDLPWEENFESHINQIKTRQKLLGEINERVNANQ